ncbi:MAG: hypothetical protein P8100_12995 [bacterium]|jgi:hypothetical protein
MEFKINIVSDDQDFALQQTKNLKNWIEDDEEIEQVKVNQARKELEEDDAGGGLLSILQVIAGAALEPIAKTIQVWMQERTKRSTSEFSVELESPDGKKFKINSKNIGNDEKAFVNEIISRFEGKQDYDYKITES